ncbi:hypothetical protein PR048_033293 [Dryococelus australis]|uniref:Uncharacterized protein n=1 Tax=Dryococelus australis TaxID=614101 RepID=A0ABQ9G426_9NEOP|nr:hypothetical protein PR048_033293 [Dryococelus australis]
MNDLTHPMKLFPFCIIIYAVLIRPTFTKCRFFWMDDLARTKNITVVEMLVKWFYSECSNNDITRVQLIFPVVSRFFIPPDRVFGRIEKIFKKRETIISPQEYHTILEEYGTVKTVDEEVPVCDWKSAVGGVIKPPSQLHFKFASAKMITLTKSETGNNILVKEEVNYMVDTGVYKTILKHGRNIQSILPYVLPIGVPIKPSKCTDVDKLLTKHFGADWGSMENLEFYQNVIDTRQGSFDEGAEEMPSVIDDLECSSV